MEGCARTGRAHFASWAISESKGADVTNRIKTRVVVALIALATCGIVDHLEAQVTPRRCAAPEYRQFDFWAGDWEVRDKKGELEGSNLITLDHDGCVLTEHWSSPGQTGASLTMYDFRTRLWTQSWYDSFGNLLVISGDFENGSLTLQGHRLTPEGKPAIERCVWTPLSDGRVYQYWDTSLDEGKTWTTHFEGFYTRRQERKGDTRMPDETQLKQLNEQYVEAFMKADVDWYQKHLADDFVCIESDGSKIDKAEFLRGTTKGPDVREYRLDEVHVRIYGDTALVQATGLFIRKDGTRGKSRYTDVYVRNGEGWKVVSAQITRTPSPER